MSAESERPTWAPNAPYAPSRESIDDEIVLEHARQDWIAVMRDYESAALELWGL